MKKEYQYRGTVRLTVVRIESLNPHKDRIRREIVLEGIRGKQERVDHTRTKGWIFKVVYQTVFNCRVQRLMFYVMD